MKKKEKIEYREKIKNTFFDVLKENDFTVENIEESNGYFLFEFGEKTVFHFNIKEIKKWKFGLWIRDGKKKDSFRIEFFGDKIDWIDKFKPTASTLSHDKEYTLEDFNKSSLEDELTIFYYGFCKHLKQLKASRHIKEYSLNIYTGEDGFLKWMWHEFVAFKWYPFRKYVARKLTSTYHKLIKYYLEVRYRKYIEEVEIVKTPFFMHDTDIEITYKEGIENEVLDKITEKIDSTLTTKVLNPFRYLIGESELTYYQVSESGQIE